MDYITKSSIRERGWTQKLITIFLPNPDLVLPNPHGKKRSPMKLYDKSKVIEIEQTEEFKRQQERAMERVASANKAIQTKTAQLMAWVENLTIDVPFVPKDKLIQDACNAYNAWQAVRELRRDEERYHATPDSDEEFLNRIVTNYLRHCMTPYDAKLRSVAGKTGKREIYCILKKKVNDAILEKYDWLYKEEDDDDY